MWVGYALALAAFAGFVLVRKKDLLASAVLSAAMLPFILPMMHERFFILAEILAFAWAIVSRERIAWVVFALFQIEALLAVGGFLFREDWLAMPAALFSAAAIWILVVKVFDYPRGSISNQLSSTIVIDASV
jgi:hypothetical protein